MWRLVFLAGCNALFGIHDLGDIPVADDVQLDSAVDAPNCATPTGADLDGDGLDDGCDPCIAPPSDAVGDADSDGMLNGDDTCPFVPVGNASDVDGDGIPDACDPTMNHDLRRCTMTFSSTAVTAQLWRSPNGMWLPSPGELHGTGDVFTTESIEGPSTGTTIYIAHLSFDVTTLSAATGGVYARGGVSSSVLGCLVRFDPSLATAALIVRANMVDDENAPLSFAPGQTVDGELIVTLSSDKLGCIAHLRSGSATFDDTSAAPYTPVAGTFGATTDSWTAHLVGLEVLTE